MKQDPGAAGRAPVEAVDLGLLEQAVQNAHFHALLMSIVHLTGDVSLLTEERRARITDFVATDNGIAPEENARVRALARQVLTDHFASRLPPAPALDAQAIQRMMDFITGTTLPERYLPFLQEELGVASADSRHPGWVLTPEQRRSGTLNALIIGAGMSGLLSAIRLQQAGIPFRCIEKNADVGGTWLENTYPGLPGRLTPTTSIPIPSSRTTAWPSTSRPSRSCSTISRARRHA